jgi:hypothetical protein
LVRAFGRISESRARVVGSRVDRGMLHHCLHESPLDLQHAL